MGLTSALSRVGGSRAHVLVAEAPGSFRARVGLERAVEGMGWCLAESVADADVLAVVGEPSEAFAVVVERVWEQMSEPRARVHLRPHGEPQALLDQARDELSEWGALADGSAVRERFTPSADSPAADHGEHGESGHGESGHEGHGESGHGESGHEGHGESEHEGHGESEHEGHGESGHGESGHGESGHEGHGAMMPDGIALAEGAADRDGLEMDVLHLPLGPVLRHWPPGVVLHLTLHGDVVFEAAVERLGAPPASTLDPADADARARAARLLDAAGSFLELVGLPAEAGRARRLRDRCLDGDLADGREVSRLGSRVGRRRTLRWLLGGLTVSGSQGGSVHLHDRLLALFDQAHAELDGTPLARVPQRHEALPELVRGQELAAVRLWLAVMTPDLVDQSLTGTAHG